MRNTDLHCCGRWTFLLIHSWRLRHTRCSMGHCFMRRAIIHPLMSIFMATRVGRSVDPWCGEISNQRVPCPVLLVRPLTGRPVRTKANRNHLPTMTLSRSTKVQESTNRISSRALHPMEVLPLTALPDATRKFPYRLLDETGGPALLVGWLSQHKQLGVVTIDENLSKITMYASAGASILRRSTCTDWAYAQLIAPAYLRRRTHGPLLACSRSLQ